MSDWNVVVPEATTNLIVHPSMEAGTAAELAAYVAVAVATRAQSTTQSRWGLYSLAITPHAANPNSGVYYQVVGAVTTIYTLSVWVFGSLGVAYQLRLEDSTPAVLATTNFVGTGTWQLVEVTGTTLANATIRCHLTANLGGTPVFYADGWQLEQKAYRTTYCDGERGDCEWAAVPHASPSSRSAQSRAGGRIRDLELVYGLNISGMSDFGVAPLTLTVDEYAILPGGEMAGTKIHPRSFILSGTLVGTSTANLHSLRQALVALFDPEAYPGEQPILFRYTGAAQEREIAAYYQDGLEAVVRAEDPCWWEKVALRFIADKPFWYEVGQTSWLLNHTDPLTFRYIGGRLRSTGQWDDLGLTANPVAPSPFETLVWGPDGRLYGGGNFTGLNGSVGAASIDYIAVWDPLTDTWSQIGAAGDFNATIYKLAFDFSGLLHIGGAFTNVAGLGAGYEYLVTWDGTNWGTVGVPGIVGGRSVRDMAWDSVGDLYVAGIFTAWAGGASDFVSRWDGVAWNAVGDPDSGGAAITVFHAIIVDSQDIVYVGGEFTNLQGDATADYVAQYTIAAGVWLGLGTLVLDNVVHDLALRSEDDAVYAGGEFTAFGATALSMLGLWIGTNWEPLGEGIVTGTVVNCLKVAPDGILFVGGDFSLIGDIAVGYGVARWNGTVYSHLDVNFGFAVALEALETGSVDPIVGQNYDVFVGTGSSIAGVFAGTLTVANAGTELMFPSIKIYNDGATVARIKRIRNETTGRELLCDYALLDDEELEIALKPTEKEITSSYFGSRPDAVQAASDFGSFALQVGSNQITCFIDQTGGAVVAWMVGRTMFAGQD